MESMYHNTFEKPILGINHSFSHHHPTLGIFFKRVAHKYGDNYDMLYYDVSDIFDFIVENRIPSVHYGSQLWAKKLNDDALTDFLEYKFMVDENVNNDHHNM